MQTKVIYQSYHEKLVEFEKKTVRSKWDAVLFVVDGEYTILPHSKQKPIVLRKNEIAFIPALEEFDRKNVSPVTYHYFCFSADKEHRFFRSALLGKLMLPTTHLEAIFESIRFARLLPDNRELIAHIVEHVFAEHYLFCGREKANFKPLSEDIEEILRYMSNHLDQKIDIGEIAKKFFLSHSGLIWKFRKELNTTPSQYLYYLRMRNAERLLLNDSYSITEISEMCGYQSPFYFTKTFHQHVGMNPTEFRKYHLNKQ